MSETYTIRPFRGSDLEGFRSLSETVFGDRPSEDWFRWKYQENPYVDHVPIYVAETDGELVGARSFFALPLRLRDRRLFALEPCDTMVDGAHRRRGLFTRMTRAALERYRSGRPDLCVNYPNERTLPGNRKLGWRVVRERRLYYRVQDPAAVASTGTEQRGEELLSRLGSVAMSGYLSACDSITGGGRPSVSKRESVPAELLASLHRRATPPGIHADRDERFLEWRFENPAVDYETYLSRSDGDVVAAVVVGTRTDDGIRRVSVVDALPVGGSSAQFEPILDAVLERARDADLVVVPSGLVRPGALLARGFVPDDKPPLSLVTETTTLVVRSLTGDWEIDGAAIDDPANWSTTHVERDTE